MNRLFSRERKEHTCMYVLLPTAVCFMMMAENYMFLSVFTCAERVVPKMRKVVLWARLRRCWRG